MMVINGIPLSTAFLTGPERTSNRAGKDVEIGDGDDNPVGVGCRRLLNDPPHVRQVAARRIAVLDRHTHLIAGDLDGVLDGVPPGIGIRCVADEDEPFALGRRRGGRRAQNTKCRQGP